MTIWRFSDPGDEAFAVAQRRGTWTPADPAGTCSLCSASRQTRVQPLVIAWGRGSLVVGDFAWPGFDSEVIVSDAALDVLRQFVGFEPAPIQVVDEGSHRGSLPATSHGGAVAELFEVWVTKWVGIDRALSTAALEHACQACGSERWVVDGVEHWESAYDPDARTLLRTKKPRVSGAGLFVPTAELAGADIFRVRESPAWIFCTDRVRRAVLDAGLTNAGFMEMGEMR